MRLLRVLTVMFFLPLSARAHFGTPFDGQVLEYGTRAPVAGAMVVARWLATWHSPWQSSTECGHVEVATTDANGRFHIPFWTAHSLGFNVTMGGGPPEPPTSVYKTGYAYYDFPAYFDSPDYKQHVLFVKRFQGTREERLEHIHSLAGKECGSRDDYAKKLIPLYRALYNEARSIAVTQEEKHTAGDLHYSLDRLEFGDDASLKRLSAGAYEK